MNSLLGRCEIYSSNTVPEGYVVAADANDTILAVCLIPELVAVIDTKGSEIKKIALNPVDFVDCKQFMEGKEREEGNPNVLH